MKTTTKRVILLEEDIRKLTALVGGRGLDANVLKRLDDLEKRISGFVVGNAIARVGDLEQRMTNLEDVLQDAEVIEEAPASSFARIFWEQAMIEHSFVWEDINFRARLFREEKDEHHIDFEVIEADGCNEEILVIRGSVKWDGCSNFSFPRSEQCMIHTCNKHDMLNIGVALCRVYDEAAKLIPAWLGWPE